VLGEKYNMTEEEYTKAEQLIVAELKTKISEGDHLLKCAKDAKDAKEVDVISSYALLAIATYIGNGISFLVKMGELEKSYV
jgi:flagellar motility protein MotE (MotC chaperone)